MSRIGNKTITIPQGVELSITSANEVTVKGPKGSLTRQFSPLIKIQVEDSIVTCVRANEEKHTKQLHGTTRAILANMIEGVHQEFTKHLEINGIGYKAAINGNKLVLNLGYSHIIEYPFVEGIKIECPSVTEVKVTGIDKQLVGEVAANIRNFRKPEPYKGKGIKYKGEHIRRKEGKTAAK